ncbi:actin-related protein 6 [Atheta coriaria]|uniref:actin-related protein 6 n=1 Tax=Dalotia coriaria TaxID=877792 RepID=UPI0031F470E1
MEAAKRSRIDAKCYNEQRNYRKRSKVAGAGLSGKDSPVKALILDNGGYSIKVGYSTDKKPLNLPNCIMKAKSERKRVFVSDQIEDCRDLSGLYYMYPHEKGYITKFDIQKNVWDYTFNKYPIYDNTVMLTQPIYNFKTIQEYTDEIFFEEYDIKSIFKANATDLCYYKYNKQFKAVDNSSCLVVDSGFSFTHIVPYINGKKYADGIIRINLGGKLLTNYLKDVLSYRQLHVMDETYVINQVKEDLCFMANNFKADMHRAKTTHEIVKNYVLPDFHNIRRGYIQENPTDELAENCQILRLNNERITIPEVMLRPSIIPGYDFAGMAECIGHSIKRCPKEYQAEIAQNVILVGGNTLFPGFRDRLEIDARIFLPCDYDLKIYQPDDPLNYAWLGGRLMSKDPAFRKRCVSKQKYEEEGSNYLYDKFNAYSRVEKDPPKDNSDNKEEFSYLNYWKNEGVDIFQKEPLAPVKDPEIQFKLEGENIEEYDGKFVSLDFEIENPAEEKTEEIITSTTAAEDAARLLRRKRSIIANSQSLLRPTTVLPTTSKLIPIATSIGSLTPTLTTLTTTATSRTITTLSSNKQLILGSLTKSGQLVSINSNMLKTARVNAPNILNNNIVLPRLTRIQPRVIRPVFKTVQSGTIVTSQQGKITQYISLGNSVNLSSLAVQSTASSSKTVLAPSILNNAVIVPQNMLASKNLTFQIIPIKPGQGNIILTQAKTSQEQK